MAGKLTCAHTQITIDAIQMHIYIFTHAPGALNAAFVCPKNQNKQRMDIFNKQACLACKMLDCVSQCLFCAMGFKGCFYLGSSWGGIGGSLLPFDGFRCFAHIGPEEVFE